MTQNSFQFIVLIWVALAIVLFPIQLKITAPYGRHNRTGLGPQISSRVGWILMESVSLIVFGYLFVTGTTAKTLPMWIFATLWIVHYVHRSFIYPLFTRSAVKTIPLIIVIAAAAFNVINGGLNGAYLGSQGPTYPATWVYDPRFIFGLLVFALGAGINIWADYKLIALRGSSSREYSVPKGGLFTYVSCPNHLGEIIEWTGFALMCWNLPAFSFAIWTAANLIPRAISHHKWYKQNLADYPRDRRAVLPFLV